MLDLLDYELTPLERLHISLVRLSHGSARASAALRFFQHQIAVRCVNQISHRILDVAGDDRVPEVDPSSSLIVVCNHVTPFDLGVTVSWLVARRRLRQRLMFPVRSGFFYGAPLGMAVNGASGLSLYPPLFNVPRRAALNTAALEEAIVAVRAQPTVLGLHPEGTRSSTGDPYELAAGQAGMGRILLHARVPVIPVFILGLGTDLKAQVLGGLSGTAPPVLAVFGEPVELDDLRRVTASPAVHRQAAQRATDSIAELGAEERGRRLARGLLHDAPAPQSEVRLRPKARTVDIDEQVAAWTAAP